MEYDEDAEVFHGEVVNLRDVVTFEGKTVEELKKAFTESIDDYLEFCEERNEDAEKPFSGRFLVRVDPTLHKRIHVQSKLENKSLNSWVNEVMESAVDYRRTRLESVVFRKMPD